MAQYKVPQDVEAEDKLLGPFTFRQFVYLMIIGGLVGLGVLFWGIFPPLIIVLVPPVLLLGALALPIKKDQPMETYLSAVVSFYLKPHTRIWEPGEPESTIVITAPKQKEKMRTKDLDQEEALNRLSFLADIIDTEGYAIKGVTPINNVKAEVFAEAYDAPDMFGDESSKNDSLSQALANDASDRYDAAVDQIRAAIDSSSHLSIQAPLTESALQDATLPQTQPTQQLPPQPPSLPENPLSEDIVKSNDAIIKPDSMVAEIEAEKAQAAAEAEAAQAQAAAEANAKQQAAAKELESTANPNLLNLANNNDFTIETIAKQAKRIQEKKDDEVYISLH